MLGFDEDGTYAPAMVPFADQINPSSSPNVNWRGGADEQGRIGFFMRANRDIRQGEQIFTSYPEVPNWQLLHAFGFVDPENTVKPRYFLLRVELNTAEWLHSMQASILGASSLTLLTDSVPSVKGFSPFRVLALSEADFETSEDIMKIKESYEKTQTVPIISRKNERDAMRRATRLVRQCLGGFPRTLEGEQRILEESGHILTRKQRSAVRVLIEEKEVMHSLIEATEWIENLLSKPLAEAIEVIKTGQIPEHLSAYLKDELLEALEREL